MFCRVSQVKNTHFRQYPVIRLERSRATCLFNPLPWKLKMMSWLLGFLSIHPLCLAKMLSPSLEASAFLLPRNLAVKTHLSRVNHLKILKYIILEEKVCKGCLWLASLATWSRLIIAGFRINIFLLSWEPTLGPLCKLVQVFYCPGTSLAPTRVVLGKSCHLLSLRFLLVKWW